MYDATRPFVLLIHLLSLIWFIAIQYYRFKQTGRACSGDYIQGGFGNPFVESTTEKSSSDASKEWPKDKPAVPKFILLDQGFWILVYIVMQYALYIICKISAIIMTNKLEAEYEEERARLAGVSRYYG